MRAWLRTTLVQVSKLSLWWPAVVLYILALMLPAVDIGGRDLLGHATAIQTMPGVWCLGIGLLAPTPAWANVALALAAILGTYQKNVAAMIFTSLAVLLAASSFLFVEPHNGPHNLGMFALRGLRIGFWFWLASCVLMLWARIRQLSPPLVGLDDDAGIAEVGRQSRGDHGLQEQTFTPHADETNRGTGAGESGGGAV